MTHPKISIIVPVYNVEEFLPTCLDSILSQTFKDFEVICVNDGSPDNSAAILENYAAKDSRIKIITQDNAGLSAARNSGWEQAQGEYLYFLDSDDYIHPQMLEILYKEITSGEYDFVSCLYQKVYGSLAKFPRYNKYVCEEVTSPLSEFCAANGKISTNVWSKLYSRKALGDLRFISGLIYEDLPFNSFFFESSRRGKIINLPLYCYLQRASSLSGGTGIKLKNAQSYIYILHLLHEHFGKHPLYKKLKSKFFASILKTLLKQDKNPEVLAYVKTQLQDLYAQKIISYSVFPLRYRIKLWYLLHHS